MHDIRGSLFRKWDLHVHTPSSIIQHFRGGPDSWSAWLDDIEALPHDFAVLGINDYLFIDGYERVCSERERGRLQNIKTILPVIEFRVSAFGGSASSFSRLNVHVIFSDALSVQDIKDQFLSRLAGEYRLDHDFEGITWGGSLTPRSLADLGDKIKERTPENKRASVKGGQRTGFDNLTLPFDKILTTLKSSSFLTDKYLIGVGKTEWDSLQWSQAAADKRDVVSRANLLFTASNSPDDFIRSRNALIAQQVNNRLLDCSDAHHNANSTNKDRIGNCATWIKADPTFEGLRIALTEYDKRVFVGVTPALHQRLNSSPEQTLERITIAKTPTTPDAEAWFDTQIPFNPGLITIIGPKGSGKSALADIIGLLGNSTRHEHFSFLNREKFRHPQSGKSHYHQAAITWHNNTTRNATLDQIPELEPETINYLPQQFLEKLCNHIGNTPRTPFDEELETVIFSHVHDADKLGRSSLEDLIAYKTDVIADRTRQLRQELHTINRDLIAIELQLRPEHRQKLEHRLQLAKEQLAALDQQQPPPPTKPADDPVTQTAQRELTLELQQLNLIDEELTGYLATQTQRRNSTTKELAIINKAQQRLQSFAERYAEFTREWNANGEFASLDLKIDQLLEVTINDAPLRHRLDETTLRNGRRVSTILRQPAWEFSDFLPLSVAASEG